MSVQATTLVVALVAAVASVGAAVLSARGQRLATIAQADWLSADKAQALLDRYQEPLLRAAYDLQSRLYNILKRGLLSRGQRDDQYIERSTVWLLGQYLGWTEIVRREAQFLKPAAVADRAELQELLGHIARAMSSDSLGGTRMQIQRSEQRALGEIMIIDGRDSEGVTRSDCLGFAAFSEALADHDSSVSRWFSPLLAEVWPDDFRPHDRLLPLQLSLIALIDHLDPDETRFPNHRLRAITGR